MNGSDNHSPVSPARVVLAERSNAGIQVTLLWTEDTNTAACLVHDDSIRRPVRAFSRAGRQRSARLRAPLRIRSLARRRLP